MAIQMTRAEYQAKYGVQPDFSNARQSSMEDKPKKSFLQKAEGFANALSFGIGKKTGEAIGTLAGGTIANFKGTGDQYDWSAPKPLQVAGDVAAGALTIAGFKGIKPTNSLLRNTLKEGALDTGAGVGSGVSQGKDIKGVAKDALIWGGTGAAFPTVLKGVEKVSSAAGNAVNKGVKAVSSRYGKVAREAKATQKAMNQYVPDISTMSKADIKDNLMKGRISPETVSTPSKYVMSDAEKKVAQKNFGLIDKKSVVKTADNITGQIAKKDGEVGEFLRKNNSIYNSGELKNHILDFMKDVDDIAIDPARVSTLKNNMADGFIKALKKNDMESLWKARKEFDNSIDKLFSGSPTMQKTIKRQFRNSIQDFIKKRTPNGVYQSKMDDMSELYDLFDVVSDKVVSQKGRNKIMQWIKQNPGKMKLIGGIGGSAVGIGALQAIIE